MNGKRTAPGLPPVQVAVKGSPTLKLSGNEVKEGLSAATAATRAAPARRVWKSCIVMVDLVLILVLKRTGNRLKLGEGIRYKRERRCIDFWFKGQWWLIS